MSWIEITYRVLFSFVVLLIMTRLMGKEHMELTVLKKPKFDYVTNKDMPISVKQNRNLPVQIINNDKIIESVMTEYNLDINWVHSEVKRLGYKDMKDIFYAGINSQGQFFIVPLFKENRYQNH